MRSLIHTICRFAAGKALRLAQCPYKVLNVSLSATPEEIRAAYYDLAKLYHPDVAGSSKNQEVRISASISLSARRSSKS